MSDINEPNPAGHSEEPDETAGGTSGSSTPSADEGADSPAGPSPSSSSSPASGSGDTASGGRPRMGFGGPGPQSGSNAGPSDPFGGIPGVGGMPGFGGMGFGLPGFGAMPGGQGQMPDVGEMLRRMMNDPAQAPMVEALSQLGIDPNNPAMMAGLTSQLQALFAAAPEGGLNTDLATQVARQVAAAGGAPSLRDLSGGQGLQGAGSGLIAEDAGSSPSSRRTPDATITAAQQRAVDEAVQVAGLWLDQVTDLTRDSSTAHAWSRAEWVEGTMPTWASLVSPVATGVNGAVVGAMRSQLDQLPEDGRLPEGAIPGMPEGMGGMDLRAMFGQMEPMMQRMSSSMFGAQLGQAVGNLAGEVLTGTEVGLPLVTDGSVVLLPGNIAAYAEGLEIDEAQVLLYLAVRESARARLFDDAPWLGPQLLTAVEDYARDIRIDTEAIESSLAGVDPSDPQAMQEALTDRLFSPEPSPAQAAALRRLETWLALVEGWVDRVTDAAVREHLPAAAALSEAVRRRRASGGPAEAVFAQLVGLQLRPRRLRDAANLFAALDNAGGASARDAVWGHPDLAPGAADLDDPLGFVERVTGSATGSAAGATTGSTSGSGVSSEETADGSAFGDPAMSSGEHQDAGGAQRVQGAAATPGDAGRVHRAEAPGDDMFSGADDLDAELQQLIADAQRDREKPDGAPGGPDEADRTDGSHDR